MSAGCPAKLTKPLVAPHLCLPQLPGRRLSRREQRQPALSGPALKGVYTLPSGRALPASVVTAPPDPAWSGPTLPKGLHLTAVSLQPSRPWISVSPDVGL